MRSKKQKIDSLATKQEMINDVHVIDIRAFAYGRRKSVGDAVWGLAR